MKKMTTLFKKNMENLSRVTKTVNPENIWVYDIGIATRKFDGTACAILNGRLYKRFDSKMKRKVPDGAIECSPPDEITGHHPFWVPCLRQDPSNKYHFEAFDKENHLPDGTYELIGEKINGNKENILGHMLLPHGANILDLHNYSYDSIFSFLRENFIEGIVFKKNLDGRMCKIRRKDFGLKW